MQDKPEGDEDVAPLLALCRHFSELLLVSYEGLGFQVQGLGVRV